MSNMLKLSNGSLREFLFHVLKDDVHILRKDCLRSVDNI